MCLRIRARPGRHLSGRLHQVRTYIPAFADVTELYVRKERLIRFDLSCHYELPGFKPGNFISAGLLVFQAIGKIFPEHGHFRFNDVNAITLFRILFVKILVVVLGREKP